MRRAGPPTIEPTRRHERAVVHLDLDGGADIFAAHGWRWTLPDDTIFETGLRAALEFFDRTGIRATLFAIADALRDPCHRELLRDAARRGHEIASHSLSHRKMSSLPRDEKRREVFESRAQIAAALGVEAWGFRAPGFDIDRDILELLDEAGYRYDSSLFPGSRQTSRVGAACVTHSPHAPLPDCRLLELPLPAYRPLPLPAHPSYSLVLGTWYFRAGLWGARRTGAPFVLLFHLTDFAAPLAPAQLPGWGATLFTLSYLSQARKLERCRRMLDLVRHEYEITSTAELLGLGGSTDARTFRTQGGGR